MLSPDVHFRAKNKEQRESRYSYFDENITRHDLFSYSSNDVKVRAEAISTVRVYYYFLI